MKEIIKRLSRCIPDKMYLQLLYYKHFRKFINFKNPETFNEKLNWLKLYDRRPEYTSFVDKYAVREIVAEKLGEEYLIPLLGAWDDPHEIDFDKLPDQFVLKWNHDSGSLVICKDKAKLNIPETVAKLAAKKDYNGYWYGREWPYKNVRGKIVCEQYMEDRNGELNDYKFFCFDGHADCVMVVTDRAKKDPKFYYMSKDWKVLPYGRLTRSLPPDFTLPKPENIDEMFAIAEKLSVGFPHVRIDLYNVDGHIYFGEYTLYSQSGFDPGHDYKSGKHLGDQIVLPKKTK